jgi:hypothetical protein
MLEELRETARDLRGTLREAALLAEVEKLREAIEATEQTLATQKHRMAQLARELQKEPGHLARLAGSDAGSALVGMIRGMAGQPQRPAAPQQPPPQVIHVPPPRSGSARLSAPQTIRIQPERPAAAPPAAPARPAPVAAKPAPAADEGPEEFAVLEEPAAPEASAAPAAPTPSAQEATEAPPPAPAAESQPQDELDAHERLLVEAIDTGRHALADLDECVTQAQELARAGVWHIVKGVVSAHSPERAKIDAVRSRAHEVQALLGTFEQQVRVLREQFGHRVDAADLKGFATRFAAALAAGPQEEHLGHRAIEAARAAYHDVRRMCTRLQLDAIALRAERAARHRFGRKHGLTA